MATSDSSRARVPQVRDFRFALDTAPRHWHGGRRSVTLFFDNLSVFFPAGERFFVASVKRFRNQVQDEALRAQADAFCAQEGHHSREHVRYNRRLAALGYPVEAMERRVEAVLQRAARRLSPRRQLAVTCALEHFTSLLASLVFERPELLEGADPQMAALWRWHSAEEAEHHTVAFDVYSAVGGTWSERCRTMAIVTCSFWGRVLAHQVQLMHRDGILFSAAEWAELGRFLFVEPGGLLGLVGPYLQYYRPGFHPSDINREELLERWMAHFASDARYQRAAHGT